MTDSSSCFDCPLKNNCIYAQTFEPSALVFKHESGQIPSPFIINPPPFMERIAKKAGDTISLDMHLFGPAIQWLPIILTAWQNISHYPVGGQEKGFRFQLQVVELLNLKGETVQQGSPAQITGPFEGYLPDPISFSDTALNGSPENEELSLQLLTPLRLRQQKSNIRADQLDADIFIKNLLRRYSLLVKHYSPDKQLPPLPVASYPQLPKKELRWRDWQRWSNRQQKKIKLGGLVGNLTLKGDFRPYREALAYLPWINLGKSCNLGLGRIQLSSVDPTSSLTPLFYICVLSEFNLPQLEAILARRPSDVVFVVSDFAPAQQGAENLSALLAEELPGIRIHRPELGATFKLEGDDLLNAQQWTKDVLSVYLNQHRGDKACWLNMTGGTKTTSLALTLGYSWDQLDYKPAQKNSLFSYHQNWDRTKDGAAFSSAAPTPLPPVTPHQVARTYNRDAEERPANPLRQSAYSLSLAQALFEGLESQDRGLMQIFNGLSRIWSQQRDKTEYPQWQKPLLTLPLSDFLTVDTNSSEPDLHHWLQRLQQLDKACFRLEGDRLIFPGNRPGKNRACRNFREWLSGDWLEQLTGYWLTSAPDGYAIPETAIAYGLKAGDTGKTDQAREADLLIHHKGRTHIIEVKADIPPGSSSKDATQQLNSQHAFGKVNRLLMIGPEYRQQLERNYDWQGFKTRCLELNIQLCSNRAELLDVFNARSAKR